MSLPVIFLDVDGVLNSHAYAERCNTEGRRWGGYHFLDPEAVARLDSLVRHSGAIVVVSSSWRIGTRTRKLQRLLGDKGFTGCLAGRTPILRPWRGGRGRTRIERGDEIACWMSQHGVTADRIVILDDDSDMAHLAPRLVQTSFAVGLTDADIHRALALLALRPS
jgi:hypothetical protein